MAPNPKRQRYRELNEKIAITKAEISAKRDELSAMQEERRTLKDELAAQAQTASD